jgi:hypothetical protein
VIFAAQISMIIDSALRPTKFPEHVADSVFAGILASAKELSAGLPK